MKTGQIYISFQEHFDLYGYALIVCVINNHSEIILTKDNIKHKLDSYFYNNFNLITNIFEE